MKFIAQDNQLTIKLEGWEQVWALKRRVQIPHFAIADMYYMDQPKMEDFQGFWRLPGTSLPWRFLAGSFVRKGEREFWYLHLGKRQPGMLVVALKDDTLAYDRVRITCKPDIAQGVIGWWRDRN